MTDEPDDWFEFEDPDDYSSATGICEDCWGDSVPMDDCFGCSTCAGRGWVYVEMIHHPHLSHWDVENELRKQRERDAAAKVTAVPSGEGAER